MTSRSLRAAIQAGMEWARLRGRMPGRRPKVTDARIAAAMRKTHLTTEQQARLVGLSKGRYIQRRKQIESSTTKGGNSHAV